jgi:uroporphyrinogen-III synthase
VAADTVVLTQPTLRTAALVARLRSLRFVVEAWPLGRLGAADGVEWPGVARRFAACDWVVFPSPGAIEVVLGAFDGAAIDWPAGPAVGVVGRGSLEALRRWQPRWPTLRDTPVASPDGAEQDADALLALPVFADPAGLRIMVVGRSGSVPRGVDALRARGADVQVCAAYRMDPTPPPPHAASWLAERAAGGRAFAISVADAVSGRRLGAFVDGLPVAHWVRAQPLLTQHPRIAAALRADGWRCVVLHPPGPDGLVAALESLRDTER